MPAVGKRINLFVDPLQDQYLLRRSAEIQVERGERFSPSMYLIELLDLDMAAQGAPRVKDGVDPQKVKPCRLRLPPPPGP